MQNKINSNLVTRIISALAFLVILILSYYFMGATGLLLIGVFVASVLVYEGGNLLGVNQLPSKFLKFYFYVSTGLVFYIYLFVSFQFTLLLFLLLALFFFIISLFYGVQKTEDIAFLFNYQLKVVFSWLYLGLMPAVCLEILLHSKGDLWFAIMLGMVFAGDIMAYLVGRAVGKHLVLPLISPKKTWEGAFGGMIGTIIIALIAWHYEFNQVSIGWVIGLSVLVSFFAQGGDFFESLLKRISNVKDSGNIMPGHGGLLDRVDGLLFAAPLVSYLVSLYEKMF